MCVNIFGGWQSKMYFCTRILGYKPISAAYPFLPVRKLISIYSVMKSKSLSRHNFFLFFFREGAAHSGPWGDRISTLGVIRTRSNQLSNRPYLVLFFLSLLDKHYFPFMILIYSREKHYILCLQYKYKDISMIN